jgi:hypothetical protein
MDQLTLRDAALKLLAIAQANEACSRLFSPSLLMHQENSWRAALKMRKRNDMSDVVDIKSSDDSNIILSIGVEHSFMMSRNALNSEIPVISFDLLLILGGHEMLLSKQKL